MYESMISLMEEIDTTKKILESYKESYDLMTKFFTSQGKPAGYPKGTSYIDADCIHGSRLEYHADQYQELLKEYERIGHVVFLQEERLKKLNSTKEEIINKVLELKDKERQVAVKRILEGKTQEQTAEELNYDVRTIRRIEQRIKEVMEG